MKVGAFRYRLRRFLPALRQRSKALRSFSDTIGLVYFGDMHQHDDEYDAIRGFTASLHHTDTHYAVGDFKGFDLRVVDRFDTVKSSRHTTHEQLWTIFEVKLKGMSLPHIAFIPTGRGAAEYSRLYATQPHMQPLNTDVLDIKSPEFHGRYQIVSKPSFSQAVGELLPSPVIVGMASRFWPHGIELQGDTMYVYITQHRLTKAVLESTLASAVWLAEQLTVETSN